MRCVAGQLVRALYAQALVPHAPEQVLHAPVLQVLGPREQVLRVLALQTQAQHEQAPDALARQEHVGPMLQRAHAGLQAALQHHSPRRA